MFTKLPAVARSFRGYSTSSSGQDFLSGLMKRIDNLNSEIKKKKDLSSKPTKPAHAARPVQSNKVRLSTADHPMLANRFSGSDRPKRQQGPGARRNQKVSGNGNPSASAASSTSSPSTTNHPATKASGPFIDARPQTRRNESLTSQTSGRQDRPSNAQGQQRPPRRNTPSFKSRGARFSKLPQTNAGPTKTLKAVPLCPKVTGDTFLYGKPAAMGISLLSRVAAITKRSLLESKYPYKLPKSIIDELQPLPNANRFVLKKDFDLEVKPESLASKVKEMVKGETASLNTDNELSSVQTEARDELMRNHTLNMEQKQLIYDLSTGIKSAQELLKNAAWK